MAMIIDTGVIQSTANQMHALNTKLEDTLFETRAAVNGMSSVWEGAAAEATISAYNAFSEKYFSTYKELIEDYVRFLNNQASGNWEAAESKIAEMANEL